MIKKRNGKIVPYDFQKIVDAVQRTFKASGYDNIPQEFFEELKLEHFDRFRSVEEIQDRIEKLLYYSGYRLVYNNFVTYRANHALMRETKNKVVFDSIINTEKNDITRDNGNMNADSPAGQMMKFASETTKPFVEKYMLDDDVKEAMENNYLYIHDKDYYPTRSLTCVQHPLDKILTKGFKAGHGEVRPAKRIETAAVVAAISMETVQNEQHGGQAIPAFDFYMAPYVRLTYKEEVNKIREFLTSDNLRDDWWDGILNKEFDDYLEKPLTKEMGYKDKIIQTAMNNTVRRVHQAMESFIHNANNIHSRGGNQVVFSSINYGTDTSAEGRCVIRELLLSTEQGVGNDATAIFPIQIWKMKKGVSVLPTDPNYDLYKLSWKVSARRFFPNYLNLDSTYNQSSEWDANDPKRYEHEVATMGCRTRVFDNRFGPRTSIGRGNLSFSTINLPKLAIETAIENGFLFKNQENNWSFDASKLNQEDVMARVASFWNKLEKMVELTAKQLDNRYQFQKNALAKQFPLLMSGVWNGSENLKREDTIESVINQGTLGIGFIGLAESLIALTGKHHGENEASQKIGIKTLELMNTICDKMSNKYQHNYAILATPAEGLSGYFTRIDKKNFGIIPKITDKEYYTNSNHVPVYYKCTPEHKAEIECPYHKLTKGGHIFYVEADSDITKNPQAIEIINRMAIENDGGYISINHNQARCPECNYESNEVNVKICPKCGEVMDQLSRITGYLVSTTDRWNSGKKAELNDRVNHL